MDKTTFTTSVSRNVLTNPKVDFIGKQGVGLGIAAAILVAGGIALGVWGLNTGIDFTGGRNYIVKFDQPVTTSEVASLLNDNLEGHVNVIKISTDDQVRISTNYKIETNTPEVDQEIESLIYRD